MLLSSSAPLVRQSAASVSNLAEAGLLSLNRLRLRRLARLRDPAAVRLECLLAEPARLFVTVLFVTSLSNITAILILVSQLVALWGTIGYGLALIMAFPIFLFVTAVGK